MKKEESKAKKRRKKRRQKEFLIFFLIVLIGAGLIGLAVAIYFTFSKVQNEEPEIAVEPPSANVMEQTQEEEEFEVTVVTDDSEEVYEEPEETMPEVSDVTMIFTGDVCFHDAFANMNALRNRGGKIDSSVDTKLLDEMKSADICMVNNEFPYSDRGTPLPGKTYAFRSKPGNVGLLADMGVDIVSLANNHVYDHGEEALFDTLDTLEKAGVPYVGAGRNLSEASAAYFFEVGGRKIAFISATQVERNASPDTKGATESSAGAFRCFTDTEFQNLVTAIKKADAEADLTVVYIHWGTENTDELHWAQTDQAPKIVDAGADLVIGDHPHCLQNIDYIGDTPIIYSLGNFWFNSKTLDTGMFKVIYKADDSLQCQFIPAKQHDCKTDMESGAEKQRILDYMQCISPNVTLDSEGYITNTPYTGPKIDYAAVERVPDPPATTTTITDPVTGGTLLIDKGSGQVLDSTTGLPTGIFVDPATGMQIN